MDSEGYKRIDDNYGKMPRRIPTDVDGVELFLDLILLVGFALWGVLVLFSFYYFAQWIWQTLF